MGFKNIEEFKCVSCNLELKALKMVSYVCPNCGDLLLVKDEEFNKKFESDIKKMDESKINDAINKESKIKEIIKNPVFSEFAKQIGDMLELLKDPATSFGVKAAIAAALLYLVSPIDIVPDFIPVIGYMDDIAIILLAMNFIKDQASDLYKEYDLKTRVKYQSASLIYSVSRDRINKDYNYLEEKGRRIWLLSVEELKEKGFSLLNGALIKAPENYIVHPYVDKLLIPLSTYDQELSNSQIDELTTLARIFGAKEIVIEVNETINKSQNGKAGMDSIGLKRNIGVGKTQEKTSVSTLSKCFETFDCIQLSELDQLIWIFTNDYRQSQSLAHERLFNGVRRMEFETKFDSEIFLQLESRGEIVKKNNLNIKLGISNSIKRNIKVSILFHDIPELIKIDREHIMSEFKTKLEKRKLELL